MNSFVSRNRYARAAIFALPVLLCTYAFTAFASEEGAAASHGAAAATFLWIAVLLVLAKVGSLVERFGQPAVLGELVMGVILGNLSLVGIHAFDLVKEDAIIAFLAELGVVILLFQIGLESNIGKMFKVGARALMVATVGVVLPFILGTYVVGPWVMPGMSSNAYLFLGASLTATSVGITARVFKDLGKLQSAESQIVLGAAVIDDVMGLIILAVVSAIVQEGGVSAATVGMITGKSVLFLTGSIVLGQLFAPWLGRIFSMIHTGVGMKFTLAVSFGLFVAYLAHLIGLAPIVGAFAAGLVLDPVHFRYFKDPRVVTDIKEAIAGTDAKVKALVDKAVEPHAHRHIEDIVEPLGLFLIPIFFVMTGMAVELHTLFDTTIILTALAITVAAFAGKVASGLVAGKVNKAVVGFGMVPRGEVGLIFASMGMALGVVDNRMFSVIVAMVILTTLCTPPILTFLLKRAK